MDRQTVDSSHIASVGYDPDNQILEVEFAKAGSVYHLYDVPEDVYEDLIGSTSVGSYFNVNLRNKYASEKIS